MHPFSKKLITTFAIKKVCSIAAFKITRICALKEIIIRVNLSKSDLRQGHIDHFDILKIRYGAGVRGKKFGHEFRSRTMISLSRSLISSPT